MSIVIDDRIGSKHLVELIADSELSHLDAGDACWVGNDGSLVGVEIKRVSDAVSCMFSGRLADHQLPLMTKLYDYRYLVIEGQYRPCPASGVMQRWLEFDSQKEVKCGKWVDAQCGRQRLMFSSFESWLCSMEILGGVRVRNTNSTLQTAALLVALYNWWQRESGSHKSFDVMHQHEGNGAALTRPAMLRRMAALLPGIGWIKSAAVAKHFGSVERMVNAPPSEWMEIEGIGKGIARNVTEAIVNAK